MNENKPQIANDNLYTDLPILEYRNHALIAELMLKMNAFVSIEAAEN